MKHVYLVYEECHGLVMVCGSKIGATNKVNSIAPNYGIDPNKTPLDYDGTLSRYGWDGAAWWQKEVLYD